MIARPDLKDANKPRDLDMKKFIITLAVVFCVAYIWTVMIFGIAWDPNGANLLERPWKDILKIIWIGFYMCLPVGLGSFFKSHPIPVTMGLGYLAFALIGIHGRKNVTGRLILYTLMAFITVLGTVKFFLTA